MPPTWRTRIERIKLRRTVRRLDRLPSVTALKLDGCALWPVIRPLVHQIVVGRIPRLRQFASMFASFLRASRPAALIVTPDRDSQARVACALARRAGLPSVFPQTALMAPTPRLKPLQADYVTVLDDFAARVFAEHFGANPDQIRVTGIPRFISASQSLGDRTGSSEHTILTGSNRPGPRRVALILQRFALHETYELLRAVATALAPIKDVHLTVKMHPGEAPVKRRQYEVMLEDQAQQLSYELVTNADLGQILERSSLVVSVFSNVVLEAAIMGRLVICVNLTGSPLPIPFVEQGVAIGAETADELREVLPRCLDDAPFIGMARRRQEQYFAKNQHVVDGKAAHRVARFVKEELAERTRTLA